MDSIKIDGIEFYGYHGVLESEKTLGQMFSVNCEFFMDTSRIYDDIENTVNYADVAVDIREFCENNRYDLLEVLCNDLSKYILCKYDKICELKLSIEKPHAPIPTKFSNVSINIHRKRVIAYLAIGSNLGDRENFLSMVFDEIQKCSYIKEIKRSSFIETIPYGVEDQPDFLNGAVKVETIFTPFELLDFCKNTERLAGRKATRRWGERTLDVDIISYGDEVVNAENLKIPHVEMHLRDFVLKPLFEIEPYYYHPVSKKYIREMLMEIK